MIHQTFSIVYKKIIFPFYSIYIILIFWLSLLENILINFNRNNNNENKMVYFISFWKKSTKISTSHCILIWNKNQISNRCTFCWNWIGNIQVSILLFCYSLENYFVNTWKRDCKKAIWKKNNEFYCILKFSEMLI